MSEENGVRVPEVDTEEENKPELSRAEKVEKLQQVLDERVEITDRINECAEVLNKEFLEAFCDLLEEFDATVEIKDQPLQSILFNVAVTRHARGSSVRLDRSFNAASLRRHLADL